MRNLVFAVFVVFVTLLIACSHNPVVNPEPTQKTCVKTSLPPLVIPADWNVIWIQRNSKAVVEAFKLQQETIKCYEKKYNK